MLSRPWRKLWLHTLALFPICLEACWEAYSLVNIECALRATGTILLNPRTLIKLRAKPEAQEELESVEKAPYTKCQLYQQTNAALTFVKTATLGEVCNLILRFSHAVEQSFKSLRRNLQMLRQVGCALN